MTPRIVSWLPLRTLGRWILVLSCVAGGLFSRAGADVDAVFDGLPGSDSRAHVRLITVNSESWYARWYVIENARKSIDATYFILDPDIFGRSFLGLLFKKAKEGVRVRIMVDARGTKQLARTFLGQDYLQELARLPGVEIKVYNPLHKAIFELPRDIRSGLASNHDKLVIVDGEWVITGGRNISAHYFLDPSDDPTVYRDSDVIARGEVVGQQAKLAFDEEFDKLSTYKIGKDFFGNWGSESLRLELARRAMQGHMLGSDPVDAQSLEYAKILRGLQAELAPMKSIRAYSSYQPFQGERSYPTVILDKHSVIRNTRNDITDNLVKFMDACQEEILIENPYVILTEKAKAALVNAGQRGVKITIVTNSPDSTDSVLTQALFVKEWKYLLRDIQNLTIHAIKETRKLHAKVFVFDKKIAVVGTYNMDPMSEHINSEEVAVVKSEPFARQNWHRINADVGMAIQYKIKVLADGAVEQEVGPSSHCKEAALRLVGILGFFSFLKPII